MGVCVCVRVIVDKNTLTTEQSRKDNNLLFDFVYDTQLSRTFADPHPPLSCL
jgi:hypothetical protein